MPPIYLDNSATTRVRKEVRNAMLPYLEDDFGNPSSIHAVGRDARKAIDNAREQVARLLNCTPKEVYFSPCGTLSNNVAILGRARFVEANGHGRHVITSCIEHPSVLGPTKHLEAQGWKATYLPVDAEGAVTLDSLEQAIREDTSIVSIMWANNEIGTVQPIPEIAWLIERLNKSRKNPIFFHTDAVQVPGKLSIDMSSSSVSTLSLSGHKFHAPKGIGILYVRSLTNLMPIFFGGGQEMGLFAGTEGLANIVAIGVASQLAFEELQETQNRLRAHQKRLMDCVSKLEDVKITGAKEIDRRLPGHVSITVSGAEGEGLVIKSDLKGICISSGSACHQGIIEPSHVLRGLGLPEKEAMGSLRISFGRENTDEECTKAIELLTNILSRKKQPAK